MSKTESGLGDDTTVYRATNSSTGGDFRLLHLSEDCGILQGAEGHREAALAAYPPSWQRWCPQCAGDAGAVAVRDTELPEGTDDADGTLWMSTNEGRRLHADRDCGSLKDSTVRQASANERRIFDRCERCDGARDHATMTEHTCPRCGEGVRQLPAHMRQCDGGDGDV